MLWQAYYDGELLDSADSRDALIEALAERENQPEIDSVTASDNLQALIYTKAQTEKFGIEVMRAFQAKDSQPFHGLSDAGYR